MASSSEYQPFRALIIRKDAGELLLHCSAHGLDLPVLTIPRYTRPAEQLTQQAKKRWNLETFCLTVLPSRDASDPIPQTAILEARCPSDHTPDDMEWLPI